MNHRPKKSLGQNFLKNQGVLMKIIDEADLVPTDIVLEIGPGLGALTNYMVGMAGKVIAVEKDDQLVENLKSVFADALEKGTFDLIHGDALEFDPEILRFYFQDNQTAASLASSQLPARSDAKFDSQPTGSFAGSENLQARPQSERADVNSYKLIANIPYYITGAIIEKFLSTSFQPKLMVLLVQKEVAERIVAKDKKTGGLGKESILSIAVKAYGNPYYISTVRAGSFVPAPSVDSAIIAIQDISRAHFKNAHHEQVFFQVMKAGFAHKRKTLSGNLKNILDPEIVSSAMSAAGLRPAARAEDVHIEQWRALASVVYTKQYES